MCGVRIPYTNPYIRSTIQDKIPAASNTGILLTQTHDNAVAKSFWVVHVLSRCHDKVSAHLHCLCIHEFGVLPLDHRLHEMLMDDLAESAPHIAIVHHKKVVSACDKAVAYV